MITIKTTTKLDRALDGKMAQAIVTALEQTGDSLLTDLRAAQVVPFDTGNLQNESTFVDKKSSKYGSVYINHTAPYAKRLYFHPEYNFNKSKNSNACGRWMEAFLTEEQRQKTQDTFKELYIKQLKK